MKRLGQYSSNLSLARFSRRRVLTSAAATGGLAALAGACGRGGKSSSQPSSAARGSTAKPVAGGTFHVPEVIDFFNFDSSESGKTVPNPYATSLAYDSLLAFKQGPGLPYDQMTLNPNLAQRWENPDTLTFTFHLVPNVKFADLPPVNGRALTSADVKWSFEYASRTGDFLKNAKLPEANFAYMFEGMDRIETPDASTVVVHFTKPFAPFLNYMATYGTQVVSHEIFDQDGSFAKQVVGSGPFQLDMSASQHGSHWVFKKNPDYWQSGKPYLGQIQYLILPDSASMYAGFQTKQVDIIQTIRDANEIAQLKQNNPKAVTLETVDPQAEGLYVSYRRPPFSDVRMRKALSLAIDRDAFDKTFAAGKGGWAMSESTPSMWTQAETKQILKYDPQQAKDLVSQAGFGNGVTVAITVPPDSTSQTLTLAQLLQAQLKQVGINIDIQNVDKATASKRLHGKDFDMYPATQVQFGDIDSRLYGQFYSESKSNWIQVKDPKLDALILAQRQELDTTKRAQKIKDVTRYLNANYVNFALYRPPLASFWTPALQNYNDHWQQYNWNAPNIWMQQ